MNSDSEVSTAVIYAEAKSLPSSRRWQTNQFVADQNFLRTPCEKAKNVREGLDIARRLWEWLGNHNKRSSRPLTKNEADNGFRKPSGGIGLAAPQIGVQKRVCVIDCKQLKMALVNPTIVQWSKEKYSDIEGCLSLPGQFETVFRYDFIEVAADNLRDPLIVNALGSDQDRQLCSCLQHEIAHLSGKLIDDFVITGYPDPPEWDLNWQWRMQPEQESNTSHQTEEQNDVEVL